LRGGTDAIGVGGGLLLLVALVQGKALDVLVLPPPEVPPHPESRKGSMTTANPNTMLMGTHCHFFLKEKDTIMKPPLINNDMLVFVTTLQTNGVSQ
jgi:hypothetical protein